jgi:hypothetical protein
MFPDPDSPLRRGLPSNGVVELTSAAGYQWMRAYLFVDEHPYYCRTNSRGDFVLEHVPLASYDLVCWLPSWKIQRHERDPETGMITRLIFRSPVSQSKPIRVSAAGCVSLDFDWSARSFD